MKRNKSDIVFLVVNLVFSIIVFSFLGIRWETFVLLGLFVFVRVYSASDSYRRGLDKGSDIMWDVWSPYIKKLEVENRDLLTEVFELKITKAISTKTRKVISRSLKKGGDTHVDTTIKS